MALRSPQGIPSISFDTQPITGLDLSETGASWLNGIVFFLVIFLVTLLILRITEPAGVKTNSQLDHGKLFRTALLWSLGLFIAIWLLMILFSYRQ
ncbi:transmembrane domain-containing protein [Marseillevirus Shanghai 1]|nr:transmembrane domain-containing protein [Melbournevirus]AVR53035.1 transmembrane domain-containing protein [Marseillevirus Shanghai 1]